MFLKVKFQGVVESNFFFLFLIIISAVCLVKSFIFMLERRHFFDENLIIERVWFNGLL